MAKQTKLPNIISFDSDDLPDLKNWTPGQRYRLVLDVEQVRSSTGGDHYLIDPDQNGKDKGPDMSASFKVLSVKPQYGGGAVKQAPDANASPTKSATMSALAAKAAQ